MYKERVLSNKEILFFILCMRKHTKHYCASFAYMCVMNKHLFVISYSKHKTSSEIYFLSFITGIFLEIKLPIFSICTTFFFFFIGMMFIFCVNHMKWYIMAGICGTAHYDVITDYFRFSNRASIIHHSPDVVKRH